ncbi:hypothetical protein [Rhodococcoides fascians]|uniref:hypothetical protein n=1 Tax=Rhodococcoides fascians TaxID=1828 RepID=UPI00050C51B5|nr:hypothetical protein [Rhodococcus fascians]
MTITPEMIEEVAEWVRAFDDHADDAAAETLLKRADDMKVSYAAEFGTDAALASALRTAYHDDGEVHYAKYSSVPGQWLRMAAAARAHVAGEERARFARVDAEPRVFHRGDVIPDDVNAVKTPSGKVFPHFPDDGGFGYPKDGYGFLPHDTGKGWADSELPLTEVLPEPRQWATSADIPVGVTYVDNTGDRYVVRHNGIFQAEEPGHRGTSQISDAFAPFTEVLS